MEQETPPVRLYIWRHHNLYVQNYDYESLEEAVRSGIYTMDYGDGMVHGVEVGDEWITREDNRWRVIEATVRAEEREEEKKRVDPTHVLEIQAPDGEWAYYRSYMSLEEAKKAAEAGGFKGARVREAGKAFPRVVWKMEGRA
jgi:hypothetical protein